MKYLFYLLTMHTHTHIHTERERNKLNAAKKSKQTNKQKTATKYGLFDIDVLDTIHLGSFVFNYTCIFKS